MLSKNHAYPVGLLVLIASSLAYSMMGSSLVTVLVTAAGAALILYSNRPLWLRILTIVVVPPVVLLLFLLVLYVGT